MSEERAKYGADDKDPLDLRLMYGFIDFAYWITPHVFNWFQWVAILGAIRYLAIKTHAPGMVILELSGVTLLCVYCMAFFLKHPLKIPFVKNHLAHEVISGAFGLGIGFVGGSLATFAVKEFASNLPG